MIDNFMRYVVANLGLLAQVLGITAYICACAFVLALVLGLAACLLRLYVPVLGRLATAYIEFCRATPIFVQLLWVNYVWPDLFGFPQSILWAGIIALALQSSGYLAETFRAGIEGLPKGQIEAARALGLHPARIFRHIVAPQVALVMAPAFINQMAVVIKSSTLVSVIAIPDLMFQAMKIVNEWFEPFEILTFTAIIYIVAIFAVSTAANRLAAHFRRRYGLAIHA